MNSYSRFWRVAACLPLATAAISSSAQTMALEIVGLEQNEADRWTFHHEHVLGTSLEISLHAADREQAQKAEAAILAVFDHDDALLSTWRSDSEVSRWSRTSLQPIPVSPELFAVLSAFETWRERTGGALDASVEAATRLWTSSTVHGRIPSKSEIAAAVEAMQQPHWKLDLERQTATRLSDVPLALASFTKSFISSRAADAALRAGAGGVMLNVGGDVIVRGNLTQIVALANPQVPGENEAPLGSVVVRDRAVATSGSYRRGFEFAEATKAKFPQFSHLIDPRTAVPANHILSSTVIAKDAVSAGALATALSILPVNEGRVLAASLPDVQYLLVLANGEQVRSSNWPQAPTFRTVAFRPLQAKPSTVGGLWNPAFELSVDLTLPRFDDARARRPYVAVWIEDGDHVPVRTLALWTQKPRWLPDLKEWYSADEAHRANGGLDLATTISSATRPPGSYTLKWDGKDDEGKPVKVGKYTVCIEAAREHGGYDIQRQELTFDNYKPQQARLPGTTELGVFTLDYRKR